MASAGGDWFSSLFGFKEGAYEEVQKKLRVIPGDPKKGKPSVLESKANGKKYGAGNFSTPSLEELRKRCEGIHLEGLLTVTNEMGDVAAKHALSQNRHATFQVASQFNCLEFVGPSVAPEDGITRYVMDRTQGPACSIACGAGTAFRNYFARVPGSPEPGQRRDRQIDNLADVSRVLGNVPNGTFYEVRSGYTDSDSYRLRDLADTLASLDRSGRIDEVRAALRIGVHEDVQVTSTEWGRRAVIDPAQTVTQVFGSALSVAYSRGSTADWRGFASLVLEASYEATLCAALLNADRHGGTEGSRRVFLTCLGGGVFGNSLNWIVAAMRRACARFEGYGLDVRVVTYAGAVDPLLLALERDFEPGRRPPKPAVVLPLPEASEPVAAAAAAPKVGAKREGPAAAGVVRKRPARAG